MNSEPAHLTSLHPDLQHASDSGNEVDLLAAIFQDEFLLCLAP